MKKKVLLLLASLALVTTLAVNGTFAQEAKGLFGIIAQLVEDFRNPSKDVSVLDVELAFVDYNGTQWLAENQKQLYPIYYETVPDWTVTEMETIGEYNYSFWPENAINGDVRQFITVNNCKTKPAYFRLAIAVLNSDKLHVNVSTEHSAYDYKAYQDIAIGTNEYNMHVFTYKGQLVQGQMAPPIGFQVALDKSVTNADLQAWGNDFLQYKVMAIDASVFTENTQLNTYSDALNAALPLSNDFNPFE